MLQSDQLQFWSPQIRNLKPYVPGEQPKHADLLKLNTNENPYPPSPHVVAAINELLVDQAAELRLYPDPEASMLKAAIAKHFSLEADHIFVGNGSDEVLAHIFKAFFIQQVPILFPDISYSFYPVYCDYFAIKSKPIALNEKFEIDPKDYAQDCGGVIIANPNAPTAIALPLSSIEQLLQSQPNRVVVIDEAYVDFGATSAVTLIEKHPNLVVCQTTSKSRSLAGMRVGYALAQPHLIQALDTVKNSFNSYPLDRVAIAAATASFNDNAYFDQNCQLVIAAREKLVAELKKLNFELLPSKANFVFCQHASVSASEISQKLRQNRVIVRHFDAERISNFLRITVGTDSQNQRLIDTLKLILTSN